MNKNAICTIVSLNYFAQAKSLAESVHRHNKNIDVYILIADKDIPKNIIESSNGNLFKLINMNELQLKNLVKMEFIYNITEFNTALKPYFLDFLFGKFNYENVIYLDPDIMVFNNMNELFTIMEQYSIVLTPHILKDIDIGTLKANELLKHGIYNLGFIAVKNDNNGKHLIKWWEKKLSDQCFIDIKRGLAWDQKWIDFAPALFDSVYILKNPGYNAAHWNMHERVISKKNDGFYVNSDYKLIFYHFSQYKFTNKEYIVFNKGSFLAEAMNIELTERPDLIELYNRYYDNVKRMGYDTYCKIPYGLNCFENGDKIMEFHRKLYYKLESSNSFYSNPFDVSQESSFYKWLNKENLLAKHTDLSNNSNNTKINQKKKVLIFFKILKVFGKIFGVNKYLNLLHKLHGVSDMDSIYTAYSIELSNEKKQI